MEYVLLNSGANVNCKKMLPTVTLMYCDGAKSNCFTKHRVFLAMVKCYSFWASQLFKNIKVS